MFFHQVAIWGAYEQFSHKPIWVLNPKQLQDVWTMFQNAQAYTSRHGLQRRLSEHVPTFIENDTLLPSKSSNCATRASVVILASEPATLLWRSRTLRNWVPYSKDCLSSYDSWQLQFPELYRSKPHVGFQINCYASCQTPSQAGTRFGGQWNIMDTPSVQNSSDLSWFIDVYLAKCGVQQVLTHPTSSIFQLLSATMINHVCFTQFVWHPHLVGTKNI